MTAALPAPALSPRRRRLSAWQRLLADRAALLGVLVLLLVVVSAIGARWIAPHNPNAQDVSRRLLPPLSPGHILGSDELGRDILARIVYGSRVSLIVGFVSVAIAGTIGVLLGLVSGYSRSVVTIVIDWLTNVQLAFPFILLALAVVAVTGSGLRNLVVVLAVTSWPVYTRITRGTVLGLREREFVEVSRATGGSTVHILLRHVLPNTLAPLLVIATFEVGAPDRGRGGVELPRARRAAQHPLLGQHAGGRARVPGHRVVAGHLPGCRNRAGGPRDQPDRRLAAR